MLRPEIVLNRRSRDQNYLFLTSCLIARPPLLKTQYTDTVRFAVADVEQTAGRGEQSVRPRQCASKRIGLWTIAALTGT